MLLGKQQFSCYIIWQRCYCFVFAWARWRKHPILDREHILWNGQTGPSHATKTE